MNEGKSQVFFSPNTPVDLAQLIYEDIGMPRVEDLGIYLGMPLLHKRVSLNTFEFLLCKVHNRLNG